MTVVSNTKGEGYDVITEPPVMKPTPLRITVSVDPMVGLIKSFAFKVSLSKG